MWWDFGAGFGVSAASPLAVLPSIAWLAGGAAVPTTSQTLTGPGKPAGTEQGEGMSLPWHPQPSIPTPVQAPTGFQGMGGDRRRLGSPRGSRRWHPHRSRGHIGHRSPLLCCVSIPGG